MNGYHRPLSLVSCPLSLVPCPLSFVLCPLSIAENPAFASDKGQRTKDELGTRGVPFSHVRGRPCAMTEREMFEAALDREPDDRAAFLDQACAGAPAVKKRLEALLARQAQVGSFLEGANEDG